MNRLETAPVAIEKEIIPAEPVVEAVIYEEVDVEELTLSPDDFKGRKVSVSGKIGQIEESKTGHLVHLDIPVASGAPGATQAVVAEHSGDVSALKVGQLVTVKGVCDDIHIIAVPNRCGIVVVPLIKVDSICHS